MSQESEGSKRETLDYHPGEKATGRGCLVVSIVVAVVCGIIGAGGMIGIVSLGAPILILPGIVIPLGMIAAAVAFRKRATSTYYPAIAITIISIATAMLLFGLCAGSIDLRGM